MTPTRAFGTMPCTETSGPASLPIRASALTIFRRWWADFQSDLVEEGDLWVSTVPVKEGILWSDGSEITADDYALDGQHRSGSRPERQLGGQLRQLSRSCRGC